MCIRAFPKLLSECWTSSPSEEPVFCANSRYKIGTMKAGAQVLLRRAAVLVVQSGSMLAAACGCASVPGHTRWVRSDVPLRPVLLAQRMTALVF